LSPPVLRPAAIGPDPRILARRIAVRRDEGRKRLRRLVWFLGAVVVVAAAAGATRTRLLDVDRVEISGTARVPGSVIRGAAAEGGATLGAALVDLDTAGVERAIEALPGVADARVSRHWPGTIEVTVIERVPVAAVAAGDRTAVVAADGVVTAVIPSLPATIPTLEVAEVDAQPGAVVDEPDLLAVAAALPEAAAARVAAVAPGPEPGEVLLALRDGGVVRLGPAADLGDKLVAVVTVLEQVDLTCLATLDVRVPSAPAVTRDPGCAS
jgi:cell division protein FtsQ